MEHISSIASPLLFLTSILGHTYLNFYLNRLKRDDDEAVVAATWNFGILAVESAIDQMIKLDGNAVDAVEEGVRRVERNNDAQYYVGLGGLPNADGHMECDAAIMDSCLRYGAVLAIPHTVQAISVARSVMDKCVHNILVGEGALKWATANGFLPESNVLTEEAKQEWARWKASLDNANINYKNKDKGHDTVGIVCKDFHGNLCAGTSTSGWKFKHPGRIGDAPLVGSGLYCDDIGAAVATGDGEEIMRTCLAFQVVQNIRMGMRPQQACVVALERILKLPSKFNTDSDSAGIGNLDGEQAMHARLTVAVIGLSRSGEVGAASTLDTNNPHCGEPFFPAVCWRGKRQENIEKNIFQTHTLKANSRGATF